MCIWRGRTGDGFAARCSRCGGDSALSKSAISRIVGRLKEAYTRWQQRDLSGESYPYLYLDALYLPVRVVKAPVQAVLGVRADGQKVLLALAIAGSESTAAWVTVVRALARRGLAPPVLV